MNDFTASNGLKISRLDGDGLRVAIPPDGYDGWKKLNLHASAVVALREFFQAEARPEPKPWHDAALGDVWEFDIPTFFDPFAAVYQETARGKEWVITRTGAPVDVAAASSARKVWPEERSDG